MRVYLHLADSGLVLDDLSLRLYDVEGESVSVSGVVLTPLATTNDYVLTGLPDVPSPYSGLTLTFENPSGVYHAYRLGLSESQPGNVIIPIREIIADPITSLEVRVFRDGVEFAPLTTTQLNDDGEYLISGWDSPSNLNEQWSIRWQFNDQVSSLNWTGTLQTGPSYYIHILARQSPFEYGKDPLNRVLFSCNYDCRAVYPVANFIHEIAKLISDAGLGTDTVDLFIGPQAEIPSGDGPYVTLKQTGGFSADESHNTKYLNFGLQTIITALNYDEGDTKAKSIYALLDGKRSFTVTA